MRRAALLLLLWPGIAVADQPPAPGPGGAALPDWVAGIVGRYAGTVRNSGAMECHRTEFHVADGRLVGHYWIDDSDPFDGTLTDFVAESGTSGHFTWTDRYGSGIEVLVFSSDLRSFAGLWGGDAVDPRNRVDGTRGGTCPSAAVSQLTVAPSLAQGIAPG